MPSESKTSARRIRGRAHELEALDLRTAGATFAAIGARLGISTQAAHKAVVRGLDRIGTKTKEAAEHLRALELRRLDAMLASLWPKIVEGDVAAINAALRISERRSKLTGIDRSPSEQAGFLTLPEIFGFFPKRLTEEPTEYDEEVKALCFDRPDEDNIDDVDIEALAESDPRAESDDEEEPDS